MRWTSPMAPRSATHSRGLRRAYALRPMLEQLEDRTMLDTAFASLATEVDRRLETLQGFLEGVVKTTAELPVLGSKLDKDNFASKAKNALGDFRTAFKGELAKLKTRDSETSIRDNLRTALEDLGLLHDVAGNGYQDDVAVTKDAAGKITITLNVGKKIGGLPAFTFGTGLSGLGFRVYSGGLDVNASIAYDQMVIGLNPDLTPFFDATSQSDEFKLILGAGLKRGGEITADLGFLSVKATDNTVGKDELAARFVMDVQGDSIATMAFGSPKLQGGADVNLNIRAAFDTAGLSADSQYPSIHTNFVMHWDLNGASPNADTTSLGQEPHIEFRNVTLNLGTFLSTMLGPVSQTIRDFMRPMDPILKIITTEIPLLSDISKEVTGQPMTLKSLAIVAGETAELPPDYQLLLDLFNASTALHQLLLTVENEKPSLAFDVGSFDLSGKDPRTASFDSTLNAANLTDLIPRAVGTLRCINQQLQESTPEELKPIFTLIDQRLRSAQNGAGFHFPIFDDPLSGVFRLFLGQDTDFVNYTAQFHIDGNRTQLLPLPIPLLPNLINLRLNVQYDADAYLKVGYDTYGLRKFLKTLDPGQLANGLYFDAQNPLLTMNGSVSAGLAAGLIPNVQVPVLGVEVPTPPNISINGDISLQDVVISLGGDAAKYRLLEKAPDPLFNTQGVVKAAFTIVAEAGVPGAPTLELYKKILGERVLFDLYTGELAQPKNPFLTPPPPEDRTEDVIIDLNRPKPQWFGREGWPDFRLWGGNDGQPDTIEVFVYNGYAEVRYDGYLLEKHKFDKHLGSFWIKGTEDADSLLVDGHLDRPLEFKGGLGVNSLTLDDRGIGGGDRTSMEYTVSHSVMKRRAIDTIGNFISGEIPIAHSQTTNLTLYTTNLQGASVTFSDLYNNDLNVALGRYENLVTIDTSGGGWADQIRLTSPLDLSLPFRPLGPTTLMVKDQTDADAVTIGRGHYVITDERLIREKFLQLNPGIPALARGGTGTTTIDFSQINVVEFSLKGGDRGNDIDLQSTSVTSRYKLTGGAGADTFTIGQVHHTLPGGTGLERQLGFAAVDMDIDGGGGLQDKLILDDTGTDLLPYTVRSTYDVYNSAVVLESVQELGDVTKTVSGEFDFLHIEDLTVRTGGFTTVNVHDTISTQDGIFLIGQTTIVGGSHTDIINVLGTTGSLTLDAGAGTNFITIGAALNDAGGSLDRINGGVHLTGGAPGALNFVRIIDSLNGFRNSSYFMDAGQFKRTGEGSTKYVLFDGMSLYSMYVRGCDGGNFFRMDGTPSLDQSFGSSIGIYTGDGDDFVTVRGTNGPVSLNLGNGFYQTVSFGGDDVALDAIQGDFSVSGSGFIDAFISNESDTASRYVTIDSNVFFGQTVERYNVVDNQVQYLNRFQFPYYNELRLFYTGGQGGDTVFISAVQSNATVVAYGAPGVRDTWGVGFGADMSRILGPVYIYGQAADNDFAYYYDYLNPNPQSYAVSTSLVGALLVQRPGVAAVGYYGLAAVLLYMPGVGGNTADVLSVPVPTGLGIVAAAGDVVTLGAPTGFGSDDTPASRTLADIRGSVSVYGPSQSVVRLVVDDSGNTDTTPRNIEITPAIAAYAPGTTLVGLTPPAIYWNLSDASSVAIRGGAGDKTFALTRNPSVAALSIDGGGGVNTLDYLSVWDREVTAAEDGVLVNLPLGVATGARGGIARIRNVIGSPGNDILVGNGGNVLDGRGGRDILIAGPAGVVSGLRARYLADGDADDSAGSHHGTLHGGVTFGPGYRGQGFDFNGVDAYVQVPNAPDLEPAKVTVKAWVKGTAPGRNAYILSKGADGETAASYALYTGASSGLQFYVYDGGAYVQSPDVGTGVWDGAWHHVAGTYDGAFIRLFVDGVEVGSGTPTHIRIGYPLPTSNDLFIGSYNGGYLFNGSIDEVAVYSRALTRLEIVASFNADEPSSVLLGGDGEDLLIGGTTAYDLDLAALARIQAEWIRTDIDYETRVANLTTDNGVDVPKLISGETVFGNGGGNIVSGGIDPLHRDLLFASLDLDFTDTEEGERFVAI
jgi:hypothetical protein